MGDESAVLGFIRDLRSSTAIPLWVMALAIVGAVVKVWPLIMDKLNERERDKAAQILADKADKRADEDAWHKRLHEEVHRLSERVHVLELEKDECHKNLSILRDELSRERAERMKFERILQGEGEVRQAAASAAAEARLEESAKADKAKKP